MNLRLLVSSLLPILLLTSVGAFHNRLSTPDDEGRPAQPNIVLLLTDDLGWQDVKCYDIDDPSPYETPNIDGSGKEGSHVLASLFAGSNLCPVALCDHERPASGACSKNACCRWCAASTAKPQKPADDGSLV